MARITKREQQQLQRLTRNANRKRNRLLARGVPAAQLPDRFEYQQTQSRAEINQYTADAQRFTNRSVQQYQFVINEQGVAISRAELNALNYAQRFANRTIEQTRNRYSRDRFRVIGEEMQGIEGTTRTVGQDRLSQNMQRVRYDRGINSFSSRAEYERYLATLNERSGRQYVESLDYMFLDNIKKALDNTFGSDTQAISDMIAEALSTMNPQLIDPLIRTYYTTNAFNFEFIYSEEDYNDKLAQLEVAFDLGYNAP